MHKEFWYETNRHNKLYTFYTTWRLRPKVVRHLLYSLHRLILHLLLALDLLLFRSREAHYAAKNYSQTPQATTVDR